MYETNHIIAVYDNKLSFYEGSPILEWFKGNFRTLNDLLGPILNKKISLMTGKINHKAVDSAP